MTVLALALALAAAPEAADTLPARVRRIVLHCPGGPSYGRPERRWLFFDPPGTQRLWKGGFGTHWIVWTDGSIWPRHPRRRDPPSYVPSLEAPADAAWRRRIAAEAAPVFAQAHGHNTDSVGIEVSHSGRSGEAFPPAQLRSLAWLLRTMIDISVERLTPASVVGHKDLDPRPAYVGAGCEHAGCPVFVDEAGQPFRRRVDPPESLFSGLAAEGLAIPRPPDGDAELLRVEALPPAARPKVARR